jgi:hypothetical protein
LKLKNEITSLLLGQLRINTEFEEEEERTQKVEDASVIWLAMTHLLTSGSSFPFLSPFPFTWKMAYHRVFTCYDLTLG